MFGPFMEQSFERLWGDTKRPDAARINIDVLLRHTCATRLVRAGIDLPRVMKFMGHKNIATTGIRTWLPRRSTIYLPRTVSRTAPSARQ